MSEELKKIEQISKDINNEIEIVKKGLSSKATSDDFQRAEKSIEKIQDTITIISDFEEGKSLKEYVKTLQEQADAHEKELNELKLGGMSNEAYYEKQLKELSENDEFKKAIKDGGKKEFSIKAITAGSSFTADTGTSKLEQLLFPGVDKATWLDDPVYRAINKRAIGEGLNAVAYYEENVRTDSAAKVAEGGTYADSAVTFVKRFAQIYKIGHNVPVTDEALTDSITLRSEINDLLTNGLVREREEQILTGNGTNVFYGLINSTAQIAKNWNAAYINSETVPSPDYWGALEALALQVKMGENTGGVNDANKKGFRPNIAFINPTTIFKMKLQKGTDGHYIIPPYTNTQGLLINGLQVVESFDIPSGYALVGDFTKANAYVRRDITISTSDNVASEWLTDTMRMKASTRLAFFVRAHEKYAFVYGDMDSVITDIQEAGA